MGRAGVACMWGCMHAMPPDPQAKAAAASHDRQFKSLVHRSADSPDVPPGPDMADKMDPGGWLCVWRRPSLWGDGGVGPGWYGLSVHAKPGGSAVIGDAARETVLGSGDRSVRTHRADRRRRRSIDSIDRAWWERIARQGRGRPAHAREFGRIASRGRASSSSRVGWDRRPLRPRRPSPAHRRRASKCTHSHSFRAPPPPRIRPAPPVDRLDPRPGSIHGSVDWIDSIDLGRACPCIDRVRFDFPAQMHSPPLTHVTHSHLAS